VTCVRARHDGRRRELCRLLLTHGVGDDEVVPTHPGKCRHVSERAGGVDVGEHSLVRRRQIAAEHGGKRERALRRVRKVHGNERGALRVSEYACEWPLRLDDSVEFGERLGGPVRVRRRLAFSSCWVTQPQGSWVRRLCEYEFDVRERRLQCLHSSVCVLERRRGLSSSVQA